MPGPPFLMPRNWLPGARAMWYTVRDMLTKEDHPIMTRRVLLVPLLAALLISAAGCREDVEDRLMLDMATFDRAYIPALMHTGGKVDAVKATLAMKQLKQDWGLLLMRQPTVAMWSETVRSVEETISEADDLIDRGKYHEAHTALERIRGYMRDGRRASGIEYVLDHLTDFHEHMEVIAGMAEGLTPETLGRDDMMRMREVMPHLMGAWNGVTTSEVNAHAFGFSKDAYNRLGEFVRMETENLAALDEALAAENRYGVVTSAKKVKPYYVSVFRMFGDFAAMSSF